MRTFKLLLTTCLMITIFIMVGFTASSDYPKKTNFSLSSTISKKSIKVGDTLIVTATFKNLKNTLIRVGYENDFNVHKIIAVRIFGSDNPKHMQISDCLLKQLDIKAKQKITNIRKFKMDKPGKYDVVVSVYFHCYNSKGEMNKTPIVISKTYSIQVK